MSFRFCLIWIDERILTLNSLNKIQKKMNEFQIPSDLGRIPEKIYSEEGFSNFTADQWWMFFTIYATVSLWDHLPAVDRKILTHFVRICLISVSWIVEENLIFEVYQRLKDIVELIENNHARDKITPNLHLSLHLYECSVDYGPIYAFWCFFFECMNGILGRLKLWCLLNFDRILLLNRRFYIYQALYQIVIEKSNLNLCVDWCLIAKSTVL